MPYIGGYNPLCNLLLASWETQKPQNIGTLEENQYHLTEKTEGENSRKQRLLI